MDTTPFYKELGRRIADARKSKEGLTQQRLAGVLGLSRPSMVNIEHGRQAVQAHQLVALADALGFSVLDLLPTRRDHHEVEAIRPQLAKFDPQKRNWVEKVIATQPTPESKNDDSTPIARTSQGARSSDERTDQNRTRSRRRSRP